MERLTILADALGRFTARVVPSSFSIAVLLTIATALLAAGWTGAGPQQLALAWGNGFWELLSFSMQMALVMFAGHLLALTRPCAWALARVATLATTPRRAVLLMALASTGLAFFNWGLSIVASALLVRHVVRRQPAVDYRLLVASAYFGLGATWHAGLSASAPLLVATPKHFLEGKIGVVPVTETLFSPFNLGLALASSLLLAGLAVAMHPPPGRTVRIDPALLDALGPGFAPPPRPPGGGLPNFLDHGLLLPGLFGGAALAWLGLTLAQKGLSAVNLNFVNFTLLSLAILLHGTPAAIAKAAEEAAGSLSGIVLQFPLYAGIYGIFQATGLAERVGAAFLSVSTPHTFPAVVWAYSCVVNYFVPSGGSKWAIEAPYLLDAAQALGVPPAKVVLAYAWGDMATDLIQPFWALPLLGVAKLEFREVLGFLLLAFLVYAPLVGLAFLFLL